MTCKDCLCYDVCAYLHDTESVDFDEINPLACDHFKPKSRFVELPCEVGQTVYVITECSCEDIDGAHTECEFYGYGTDDRMCTSPRDLECPYQYRVMKCSATEMNILSFARRLGKTVFLSRELAEEALNEQKKL